MTWFRTDYPDPFFECERYVQLFLGQNCDETLGSSLERTEYCWNLTIDTDFKNYDDEIDKYVTMISPFVVGRKKKQYIGWIKGEGWGSSRINIYINR